METSQQWNAHILRRDLPLERFTLGVWASPFTTGFTLCMICQLVCSSPWNTLVGNAPCTYSVYKAAHRKEVVQSLDVGHHFSPSQVNASFSPSQVKARLRSFQTVLRIDYPLANFCKDLFSSVQPKSTKQQMKFTGFASKSLNKLIHSLNGNYIWFETITPTSRSKMWKSSFTLPNGMIVFDCSFYGKNKLWIKYYRRGRSFEIETDRALSPRLYGIMLRSIASRGGGPGSRWTYLQTYGRAWKSCARKDYSQNPGHDDQIYSTTDLHYDDPSGHDDIYNMDDSDDIYIMADFPLDESAQHHSVQSGYQDRRALRGTSRGYRSESAILRRLASRKTKQQEARRDYRQWTETRILIP